MSLKGKSLTLIHIGRRIIESIYIED